MNTPRVCAAALGALFLPALLAAAVSQRIPVVTQVQGVVFYRTFLTIGVASGSPAVTPTTPLSPVAISGYAVQLDSVTNDGSFFQMTEEPPD